MNDEQKTTRKSNSVSLKESLCPSWEREPFLVDVVVHWIRKTCFSYYFINFTILRLFSSSQMIVKSTAKGGEHREHFLIYSRYVNFKLHEDIHPFLLCSVLCSFNRHRHTLDNDEFFDIHLKIETNENSASYHRQRLHFLSEKHF